MHKNKRKSLEFLKKKTFFMSQSYFYIRVSSEKNIHRIITMKINWYLFVSKLIILFHIKTVVLFVPNSTFLQTFLCKVISWIFFSFWTFISNQTLLQDNVRLFANLTNKTQKRKECNAFFCLIRLSKQEIMLKNTRFFFLFESRTKKSTMKSFLLYCTINKSNHSS